MFRKLLRSFSAVTAHRIGARSRIDNGGWIDNISLDADRVTIGSDCIIQGQLLVFPHGGRISIGDWCFIGPNSRIWSGGSITIGNRVLISHDVNIFDNDTHPFDAAARHLHFRAIKADGHPSDIDLKDRPVVIEDDAWIAAKALVLKGVKIGRGAVIAAGSVVTRDVPPYCVVAGNPARTVRMIEN